MGFNYQGEVQRFCRTVGSRVLTVDRWPLHTSQLEGIKNHIKAIECKVYGLHDDEYCSQNPCCVPRRSAKNFQASKETNWGFKIFDS
ncbi:MAG: hypothetical protein H6Q00_406 [Holophagaceae bacterium]|nr:hypothetical protein [Holophagaceae bacterium]